MFRRLPHNLPPDPQFPPDLGKLGFFVNDKDQIRSLKNPDSKYKHKINANERVNQAYKYANNSESSPPNAFFHCQSYAKDRSLHNPTLLP